MRRRPPTVAIACLLAVVACGRGEPRKRDAGIVEGPLRSRVLPKGGESIPPPPTLPMPRELAATVKDRGAEPRHVLRYRLASDAERTVVATIRVTSRTLTGGTWSEPVELPAIRHGVAVQAERAAGGPRLRLRPLAIEIDPEAPTAALEAAAAQAERWRPIAGRRVTATVDDRGRIAALAFADTPNDTGAPSPTPEPARDELWQWLLGAVVPLPDEPVGVGATWEVKSVLRLGTATIQQLGRYRLVAADADRLTVEVLVRRIGEPQAADAAGLPPGSIAELVGLFREAKGTLTVSTGDGLPLGGTLDVELRVHARFHVPDQPKIDVSSEDVGTMVFGSE